MKKGITVLSFVVLILLMACASIGNGNKTGLSLEEAIEQSAAEITAKLPTRARVAIVAFDSEHQNVSNYIMDELTGALVDGSLEVADRRNLAFVYRELDLQMSGNVSDETAVSIGKFLGAQYVIFGQLLSTGSTARYRISSVNVETAVQETSTRLTVRNDRAFRSFVAAVENNPVVTTVADYGRQSAVAGSAGAFLDRGILHAIRGDYELAIVEFTEAINLDGNLATAWLLRGRAFSASVSNISDILEDFRDFVAIVPGDGITEVQRAGYVRAIADFTRAISLDPNLAPAFRDRGVAYSYSGNHERALEDFNMAIRLNPNDPVAYRERGNVYWSKGDDDRALADYNRAINVDPNHAWAYYNRGIIFSRRGDLDRAIIEYNHAIRIHPNHKEAYNNRGSIYGSMKNWDLAIADFQVALRIDPNYTLAKNNYIAGLLNRGVLYYNRGDYSRARADWTRVLQIDPNDTTARDNLRFLEGR